MASSGTRSRWASWPTSGCRPGGWDGGSTTSVDDGWVTASVGPAADAARADVRAITTEKGHAVEIASTRHRERSRSAFEEGALQRTAFLGQALADLEAALDQEDGQKLGGKSAEASRFILRAIDRALDDA